MAINGGVNERQNFCLCPARTCRAEAKQDCADETTAFSVFIGESMSKVASRTGGRRTPGKQRLRIHSASSQDDTFGAEAYRLQGYQLRAQQPRHSFFSFQNESKPGQEASFKSWPRRN